ncbi:SPOR domain-containing protein [Subsaximicrobium wynnwilliamsii]|uniref:SPOR domain-containing protein n=1 Tax=Subsaximicrobium wynnwilliamsii TaxID=291179 RepID=A0A5C6ZDT3_9FLAO|nr:SPOR domain-containing protein [Subsaximicrobium wynnwilliamsii]TXD82422.1 SPOR domain-containing protein [Subsaximicrobium wynnwilliamsii]TXD88064.1 SPOR domain-containing protein [Subsaximicrobium wynnwilliamsii]TXE02074.1 SPOR domain-containing protein [Subsaximicrobium wynnwilliamsii]
MIYNKFKISLLALTFFAFLGNALAQQGNVTVDQHSDITKLLEYKKDVKTVNLYKIQLDFGSRAEAESLKIEFQNEFSEWPAEMVYETPNYKVWVGNFSTRLEADIALQKIKKSFTKAMVFEPKKEK